MSAQHNAMQRGQLEAYGFAPFTPAGLYAPPLAELGETSERDFFNMLPPHGAALSQLGAAEILTRPVERPLSRWPGSDPREQLEPVYARCLAGFQTELEVVSATIRQRNALRLFPYRALDPATMAACIDI